MKSINASLLLVLAFALSGCVMAYKSSRVQKEIDKANAQFAANGAQANAAVAQADGIMKGLYATGAQKTKPPYNELAQINSEIYQSHARLEKIRHRFDVMVQPVQAAIATRGKIRSDEPEFKIVRDMPEQAKPIIEDYEKEAGILQAKINAFQTVCNREKIVEVDTAQLRKTVEDGVTMATGRMTELRTDIQKHRERGKAKNQPKLDILEDDLNKIEAEVKAVQQLEAQFRKEVGENTKVVLGPHLASHTIVAKFQERTSTIQNLSNHFNKTAAEIK